MSESIRPPLKDILSSIPGIFGIRLEQEPTYAVLETFGEVEVRRYAPALLAQVTINGDHDRALNKAFDKLAAYIYGKNSTDEKLNMTSPVFQEMTSPVTKNAGGDGWSVAFFISNDLTPESAPQPEDPAIQLFTKPETILGALRFSGHNDENRRAESKRALLEAIARDGNWRVLENVSWAQYDQPFAIPFLKRNEALVEVAKRPID